MGLLAFPAMLRAGYDVRLSAGCITAGGCLGILIPPSVLLIVYGATAGVSVVQLYAGAFFPGIMLAGLYIGYVIIRSKLQPQLAPPLPAEERVVALPDFARAIAETITRKALPGLIAAFKGKRNLNVSAGRIAGQLVIALLPALVWFGSMGLTYRAVTAPPEVVDVSGLVEMGMETAPEALTEPPAGGVEEPKAEGIQEPPGAESAAPVTEAEGVALPPERKPKAYRSRLRPAHRPSASQHRWPSGWCWASVRLRCWPSMHCLPLRVSRSSRCCSVRSFPLAVLILAVLGSIVFGLATPTEAAAVGALGGFVLAAAYRQLNFGVVKESVFLTAKTSAMVCWLFVGSSIFSAAFALLGGRH